MSGRLSVVWSDSLNWCGTGYRVGSKHIKRTSLEPDGGGEPQESPVWARAQKPECIGYMSRRWYPSQLGVCCRKATPTRLSRAVRGARETLVGSGD